MKSISERIEDIELSIKKAEARTRPLRKALGELNEKVKMEEQRRAYTGKYEVPMVEVHYYTSERTIAEITVPAEKIADCVVSGIASQTEEIKHLKQKIAKINEILGDEKCK
ncbi:coil containing protein [Vibrio phage 1.148.O._10N.286.54.A10]|nr:coil containing protein [Vibrio phage 1.148.O._10N.286.54.A10]